MYNRPTAFISHDFREEIYAGFWVRLGAALLDTLFVLPLVGLTMYLNSRGKDFYLYTFLPMLVFYFWYEIYLPKRYGGTPGKLAIGLKILRTDGQSIQWREAILRHSVVLAFTVLNSIIMIYCVVKADDTTFMALAWRKQNHYLITFSPQFFSVYTWLYQIWLSISE